MTDILRIPLLRVSQWLPSWDEAEWTPPDLPEPSKHFYIGSIALSTLRRLAGVSRRQVKERKRGGRGAGYQRAHQAARSKSIARYLQYGYPISNQPSLNPAEHPKLIHPGWLPTSILVNVVGPNDKRRRAGKLLGVSDGYGVAVEQDKSGYFLSIPAGAADASFQIPQSSLEPIEIIDGQHRLFAMDELGLFGLGEEYEVPVVFFDGLTESWQAYLFWVINVEPKKINPSLAYDLYPELRSQSWLESGETINVYREHRAQELTEVLWRHEFSPWRDRIELHGNRVDGHVSNAAFIRSLMASFVRRWGNDDKIGGLFGSIDRDGSERILPWKRSQQAAFLIVCWNHVHGAVKASKAAWIKGCSQDFESKPLAEQRQTNPHGLHAAFAGNATLLGTDQGARSILVVFNALCQVAYSDIDLETWESDSVSDSPEDEDVTEALEEFSELTSANKFLQAIAVGLVDGVDWRTSSSTSLTPAEKQAQAAFRGSSGYSMLQAKCLEALLQCENKQVAEAARLASELLRR
ncbi:DGQHR domain protein [Achromobacter xylosoxidans]|uniref:DGQHR domain-containing protein n=2 Tax=Pseudomonadota TaxID=1224 RepID=UPI0012A80662|nr:DGQHR domain-containing protein [Achromobacter xylosoxidans]CUR72532.1 DGQHR domain protein [Achromobacter xylosoxidans]